MTSIIHKSLHLLTILLVLIPLLSACTPVASSETIPPTATSQVTATQVLPTLTPEPTRPLYTPGQLVDYTVQSGDTLPGLAGRFNTTIAEIRTANPIIPTDATTLPPGMPMQIPIYYRPFWGSTFQIIPDGRFPNGPAEVGFDPVAFVNAQPGWLKSYTTYMGNKNRNGGEMVEYIAENYSISPRLLLAILEYKTGALTQPESTASSDKYPLGYRDVYHQGLPSQLGLVANVLNNRFYGWRLGTFTSFNLPNGRLENIDPWQNAATAALRYLFSLTESASSFEYAASDQGLQAVYASLFGDPWADPGTLIPGSLTQPTMRMPFPIGSAWTYTGGPHTGWGDGEPLAAIDFAPPAVVGGCISTDLYATAVADGVVARVGEASVVLDLDKDGDERTGWVVFYLHVSETGKAPLGRTLKAGDPVGHPSCEGGNATGTHVHIARKYNGEWVPADSALPFNMEGWIVQKGSEEYLGTLVKYGNVVTACTCSNKASQVTSAP